jgi:hypothetical protein
MTTASAQVLLPSLSREVTPSDSPSIFIELQGRKRRKKKVGLKLGLDVLYPGHLALMAVVARGLSNAKHGGGLWPILDPKAVERSRFLKDYGLNNVRRIFLLVGLVRRLWWP